MRGYTPLYSANEAKEKRTNGVLFLNVASCLLFEVFHRCFTQFGRDSCIDFFVDRRTTSGPEPFPWYFCLFCTKNASVDVLHKTMAKSFWYTVRQEMAPWTSWPRPIALPSSPEMGKPHEAGGHFSERSNTCWQSEIPLVKKIKKTMTIFSTMVWKGFCSTMCSVPATAVYIIESIIPGKKEKLPRFTIGCFLFYAMEKKKKNFGFCHPKFSFSVFRREISKTKQKCQLFLFGLD